MGMNSSILGWTYLQIILQLQKWIIINLKGEGVDILTPVKEACFVLITPNEHFISMEQMCKDYKLKSEHIFMLRANSFNCKEDCVCVLPKK